MQGFLFLACLFFLLVLHKNHLSQASLKTVLFNVETHVEFLGYKKSSQVLQCSESVGEHEEVKIMRAWG